MSEFSLVELGQIAKGDNPPTKGRLATGTFLPVYHGAVAGKKGSKAKAAGTQLGYGFAGTVGGTAAGAGLGALTAAALRRSKSKGALVGMLAGHAGSAAGAYYGTKRAHELGYLKPQRSDNSN